MISVDLSKWLTAEHTAEILAARGAPDSDAGGAAAPAAKLYRAAQKTSGRMVMVVTGANVRPLPLRLDLRSHSPDGFAWGYGGSGPSQLALAMVADALGNDAQALACYQTFKNAFIATAPPEGFEITAQQVRDLVGYGCGGNA